MLLWIVLTTLTALAAVWLAAPLLAKREAAARASATGLEVYRDQLSEVEREARDGLIDADQAETARLEIKRRMLGAERATALGGLSLSLAERHMSVAIVTGIVALGSTILYSNMGRPDLPAVSHAPTELVIDEAAQSYAFRPTGGKPAVVQAPAAAPAAPGGLAPLTQLGTVAPAPGAAVPKAPVGSVDEMIERLAARLKKDPTNPETLRMLGWSYAATGRLPEAVDAYGKAVAIAPANPALLSAYGEVMVRVAEGQVKPEAAAIFERVLAVEPKDVRARYYKARALEQSGDKAGALELYLAVAPDVPADDPFAGEIRAQATQVAASLGVDIAGRLPAASQPQASQPAGPRGPSAADIKAAASMSEADRVTMIRGMVDGLAKRLEQAPRDPEGWLRLIRARQVLGQTGPAKEALAKAMTIFADAPDVQAKLTASAREAGIETP